jgi:alkyldihydroxyacetonephosphate synthase
MIAIDRTSLLVETTAEETLRSVETALAADGLTLDVPIDDRTIASWVAAGLPGAPPSFLDPADHLIAGLYATTHGGKRIELRPSPRRAVGPDLIALVAGAHDRFARLERVWLRVFTARRARKALPFEVDPPLSDAEQTLVDALARELSGGPNA